MKFLWIPTKAANHYDNEFVKELWELWADDGERRRKIAWVRESWSPDEGMGIVGVVVSETGHSNKMTSFCFMTDEDCKAFLTWYMQEHPEIWFSQF